MPIDFIWPINTKYHHIVLFSSFGSEGVAEPHFRTTAILNLGNLRVLVYPVMNVSILMVKQDKMDIKFTFVSHLVQKLWQNPFSGGGHIGFREFEGPGIPNNKYMYSSGQTS